MMMRQATKRLDGSEELSKAATRRAHLMVVSAYVRFSALFPISGAVTKHRHVDGNNLRGLIGL